MNSKSKSVKLCEAISRHVLHINTLDVQVPIRGKAHSVNDLALMLAREVALNLVENRCQMAIGL
jgi:hypothetical protein